jgi:signal peptidase II
MEQQKYNHIKKMTAFISIIFFVSADRLFKFLAVGDYAEKQVNILGNFFRFSFMKNYNIAFSLPFSGSVLNYLIPGIILYFIFSFIFLLFKKEYLSALFFLAIIMGAASNFYDRLHYGYVIDYLELRYFTVFNLADAIIVLGAGGLVVKNFLIKKQSRECGTVL